MASQSIQSFTTSRQPETSAALLALATEPASNMNMASILTHNGVVSHADAPVTPLTLTPVVVPSSTVSENGSTSSSSSTAASPSSVTSDMLRRGWIAPFLLHLHQMLRRENASIIRWTEDGMAFQILDKDAMTNQILPKYFKNKNFASFQRQLNYFGFRKWSKSRAEFSTYSREHFTRDNYSAMSLVKRQSKKSRKRAAPDSIEESSAKRSAVESSWPTSERCKRILPRPDVVSESNGHSVVSPSITPTGPMSVVAGNGSISPVTTKVWVGNQESQWQTRPSMWASSSSQTEVPALSAARKVPMGCKLPSLRELSVLGAFASTENVRPQWLA